MKPAPRSGWMLDGHRFVTDDEFHMIHFAFAKEVHEAESKWNMGLGEK